MARRTYGLPELLDALVRARAGQPEAFLALGAALDVEPDVLMLVLKADWQRDEHGYGRLLDSVVAALRAPWSPFEGWMEAPRGVIRLFTLHGDAVSSSVTAARAAVTAVGVDLLVFLLQVPRGLAVSEADRPELADLLRGQDDPDDW